MIIRWAAIGRAIVNAISGDFLLLYRLADVGKYGLVVFVRAGTHAELFE